MAASTLSKLLNYHNGRPGVRVFDNEWEVTTLYAYQMGPLTAAHAAHATTNKWEGVPVIPLDASDEVHIAWVLPNEMDCKEEILMRAVWLPNNNSAGTVTTFTYDRVTFNSSVAADGVTALSETITSPADADTDADYPITSMWGKIPGHTTDFDALFVKLVAGTASGADRLHLFAVQFAWKRARY